jgi:hypothetical protein
MTDEKHTRERDGNRYALMPSIDHCLQSCVDHPRVMRLPKKPFLNVQQPHRPDHPSNHIVSYHNNRYDISSEMNPCDFLDVSTSCISGRSSLSSSKMRQIVTPLRGVVHALRQVRQIEK